MLRRRAIMGSPTDDSIVTDVGELTIDMWQDDIRPEKFSRLRGVVYIDNVPIPIHSRLLGLSGEDSKFNSAVGLIESSFLPLGPVDYDKLPAEYVFVDQWILQDNYKITIQDDGERMIWEGLNRFVERMELLKVDRHF